MFLDALLWTNCVANLMFNMSYAVVPFDNPVKAPLTSHWLNWRTSWSMLMQMRMRREAAPGQRLRRHLALSWDTR